MKFILLTVMGATCFGLKNHLEARLISQIYNCQGVSVKSCRNEWFQYSSWNLVRHESRDVLPAMQSAASWPGYCTGWRREWHRLMKRNVPRLRHLLLVNPSAPIAPYSTVHSTLKISDTKFQNDNCNQWPFLLITLDSILVIWHSIWSKWFDSSVNVPMLVLTGNYI
jgi:hypothetical protein